MVKEFELCSRPKHKLIRRYEVSDAAGVTELDDDIAALD
jgi:hypothetical protein